MLRLRINSMIVVYLLADGIYPQQKMITL
jgi:hypothetical protein